jgi:predicted SAM-dependent methyltransferase
MKLLNLIKGKYKPPSAKKTNDDIKRLGKNTQGKHGLKLHFGCGPRILKGWINVDLAYEPYKEYLKYYTNKFYGSKVRGKRSDFYALDIIKQPLPIKSGSVSTIFHEDFLEHLDQREQILFLAETYRVLRKGGIHRINTPNLEESMRLHSNFKLGFAGVYQEEWTKHMHKNVLTIPILKEMAQLIGYSDFIIQKRDLSKAKNLPIEYRPDPHDRPEKGNMFVDLIK